MKKFWEEEKHSNRRSIDDMLKRVEVEEDAGEGIVEGAEEVIADCKIENVDDANKSGEPMKPLDCFGMDEDKTERWLGKCVKFWFCCMSFIWFLFGALTFAPVIFISNKVNVIFNDKKKSLYFAAFVYMAVLALIILFVLIK